MRDDEMEMENCLRFQTDHLGELILNFVHVIELCDVRRIFFNRFIYSFIPGSILRIRASRTCKCNGE